MIKYTFSSRRLVRFGFACVAILFSLRQSFAQANHFSGPHEKVDVSSIVPIQGTDSQFVIHMAYSFDDYTNVWLQGFGTVANNGNVSYALNGKNVIFRQSRSGPVLASVPVDPTEYHQSPATGDPFPPPPPAGTNWQQDAPVVFPIAPPKAALLITNTLQSQAVHEQFLFTPCRPDDEGCILSKWVMITSPAAAIQAQFAVMLTYAPASSDREKQTKVQLYYIVRQGYLGGSEWSYTVNNSITDLSAHALLDVKRALTMYLK